MKEMEKNTLDAKMAFYFKTKGECLFAGQESVIIFRGFCLYHYSLRDKKATRIKSAVFPRHSVSLFQRLISKSRLLSRLFRLFPRGMAIKDGRFLAFSIVHKIFVYDLKAQEISFIGSVRAGFANILNFCPSVDSDSLFFFGDYGKNLQREPVKIYRVTNEKRIEEIYELSGENRVRHIHNIVFDPYRKGYIVLTGDLDPESRILLFDASFKSFSVLTAGSQSDRSVVCCATERGLALATDAVEEPNSLLFYDFEKGKTNRVCPLPGSVIYGSSRKWPFLFSTTVEPTTKTKNKLSYYLTRRLGGGIEGDSFSLYRFDENSSLPKTVFSVQKDRLPLRLFGYGYFSFPAYYSDCTDWLVVTAHGGRRSFDCRTLVFKMDTTSI